LLGYVGLLQDVGKLRLPKELLDRRGRLSAAEFELAKQHVGHSVEILRATPGLPAELPRIAALHHERHDGSGYPAGLRGDEIGMLGSIAAIVDTFDALTVRRPHADPVSPSAAISMLYKARGVSFDAHLVEQFIRCIGIFPVGSLVELNSGETGVVIAQNAARRLSPRVMVIRDAAGNPMYTQKLLDLARSPRATANEPYRILGTLEYGSVPFDPNTMFMRYDVGLGFLVDLAALLHEFDRFFLHAFLDVVAHVLRDFHRAEVRPAHRAEVRHFHAVLRQRLVVEILGGVRVQAQVELVFPTELETRL